MSFDRLTSAQRIWWDRLRVLLASNAPHHAIKFLALEIIEAQPDKNSITLNPGLKSSQLLRKFDRKNTKQAYIALHKQDRVWGEDAILYPLLFTLGFKLRMFADNMWFEPFTQPIDTGLEIRMTNYTMRGGAQHFELFGHKTPADDRCMYHAVIQQIEITFPGFIKKSRKDLSAAARSAWQIFRCGGGDKSKDKPAESKRYDFRPR
jgi:hypothetical protein